MKKIALILAFLASFSAFAQFGYAQNEEVTVPDGPQISADTTEVFTVPEDFALPFLLTPMNMDRLMMPSDGPATSQMNEATKRAFINNVLYPSITSNLQAQAYRISPGVVPFLFAAALFLTPQFAIPYGYGAFNPSFPYATYYIPGGSPYENKYGPDQIPQAIRLEYDPSTGTYKQVMNDWNEVMKSTQNWHLGGSSTAPLNLGPINPVEKAIYQINRGM